MQYSLESLLKNEWIKHVLAQESAIQSDYFFLFDSI